MSGKEAVCFIIDGNSSMSKQMTNGPNRFEAAKAAAIDLISSLMIRSKTHEVCVFVLNTKKTQHHLYDADLRDENDNVDDDDEKENDDDNDEDDVVFPHVTEFSGNGYQDGVRPPTPGLLRRIHELQVQKDNDDDDNNNNNNSSSGGSSGTGGFVSGLVLAADALHKRTAGNKFQRRIVLITDAEQNVKLDNHQQEVLVALDKLREMECQLQIVGFEFERTSDYNKVPDVPTSSSLSSSSKVPMKPLVDPAEANDTDDNHAEKEERDGSDDSASDTDVEEEDDDDEEEETPLEIKRRNESLLHKLSSKTGGFVFSAKDNQSLVKKILGNRAVKYQKKKLVFEVAPGIVLEDVRCYLMISKTNTPSVKTKIATASEESYTGTQLNSLGEEMVQDVANKYEYWKADDEDTELQPYDISEAYQFGTDYLPYNPLDEAGLSRSSDVRLTICGYMSVAKIPEGYRIGTPYVVTGQDSRRSCAAISALAQALQRTNKVAIATFVKTKDKDPILVGVFPLIEEGIDVPLRLMMQQLPFSMEIKENEFDSFDEILSTENSRADAACDDLIDSLMLPDEAVDYAKIDNPRIESFYKTAVQRILDPKAPVVPVTVDDGITSIDQPPLEKAVRALEEFHTVFPLTQTKLDTAT